MSVSILGIVLIDDWYGMAQSTVGGTISRQLYLGSTINLSEHELVNRAGKLAVFLHGDCISSCPDSFSDGLCDLWQISVLGHGL